MANYAPLMFETGQQKAYFRPNGGLYATNWTRQDGGTTSQHWSIDEVTPDDADYIQSEYSPIESKIGLALTGLTGAPAMDLNQPVVLRYRFSQLGGDAVILKVRLVENTTIIKQQYQYNLTGTYADGVMSLSAAEAAAVSNWENVFFEAVASSWTPAKLFENGRDGFYYDFQDLSTMNTLSDGTGSIPDVGDPVGLILDQSGNGYHWRQPTAAKRPTLEQLASSGLYNLKFNSTVNTHLILDNPIPNNFWEDGIHFCLAYATNTETRGLFYAGSGVAPWALVFEKDSTATDFANLVNPGVEPTKTLHVDGTLATSTTRHDVYTAVNGKHVQRWFFSGASGTFTTDSELGIGAYNNSSLGLDGRLYGLVVTPTLNSEEIANLESWLAAQSGVAL